MQDYFEHIDDYIEDKLSAIDRAAFEQAMDTDNELKLAVDNYDFIRKTALDFLESDIRKTLTEVEKQESNHTSSYKKWWLIAAMMVLLSITSIGIYIMDQSTDPPTAHASLGFIDPVYDVDRSTTEENTISHAISLHLAMQSDRALDILRSEEPLSIESKYWIMEIMSSQKQPINDAWLAELEAIGYQSKRVKYLQIINMILRGNEIEAKNTLDTISTDDLGQRELSQLKEYLIN